MGKWLGLALVGAAGVSGYVLWQQQVQHQAVGDLSDAGARHSAAAPAGPSGLASDAAQLAQAARQARAGVAGVAGSAHAAHAGVAHVASGATVPATSAAAQPGPTPQFALEGSVFVGGAVVQWLRDGLQAIEHSGQVQQLAESVPDSGGVMMVPAFTGLGAPYWKPDARGTITGLTRGSTIAHIARAALESIAYQSAALLQAMSRDAVASGGAAVSELRVDGGACVNNLLMQFQADLLGIPVVRPACVETTALGAAYLAGLSTGVYQSTEELSALWKAERRFVPTLSKDRADELMQRWEQAVRQTTAL